LDESTFSDSEDDIKTYFIPKNVKARFELFEGFGLKEAVIVIIGAFIGLSLGLILWFITNKVFLLGFFVPGGAMGFLISKPNPRTGRNALDIIKDSRSYNSRPKRYFYRYGDGRGK
jgi:hypothetical protein